MTMHDTNKMLQAGVMVVLALGSCHGSDPVVADAKSGADIYAKECATCHGPHGRTKALSKSKRIAGMEAGKIVRLLKAYKYTHLNQYGLGGIMTGHIEKLPLQDMESVAHYIHHLGK